MKHASVFAFALALCLPVAAAAAPPQSTGVNGEIRREMSAARQEIRTELARARAELETENLALGSSLKFGNDGRRKTSGDAALPKAEITPLGDFLVEGNAVAIDEGQRRELLAYRGLVIDIAMAGIDIGEHAALAAVDAVDRGIFSLMLSAMTGSLERRMEKMVKQLVEPGVLQICQRLPTLLETQDRLAADLPAFRPYASMKAQDVANCENEFRSQFAAR